MQTALRSSRRPRKRKIVVGPQDHGRRMSLADFDRCEVVGGYLYELNKGVIEVSSVPHLQHGRVVGEVRDQLVTYRLANPGIIDYMGGGGESKLLIDAVESERHPDWCVYLSPAPNEKQPWAIWVPEIVIEVVSESSRRRDYEDKPPEYLALGVTENWILDPQKKQMLVKTRRGGLWEDRVVTSRQKYRTRLLPGFAFDVRRALGGGASPRNAR